MSGNIITMSVTTESEETAAQFIQYVRDMELVKSVENSGIAISTNEETVPATTSVTFSVDVTLVDPVFEDGYEIQSEPVEPNSNSGYAKDPVY